MTKKPGHSYTSMKTYDICPLQYWHKRINKTYEEEHTPQILEGWRIHSAFEKHLKSREELPRDLFKYYTLLQTVPRPRKVEQKLAVNRKFEPCDWWDKDAHFRAVLDVVHIELPGYQGCIIDWKTGKVREDTSQLKGNICVVMAHYPLLKLLDACFVWIKHGKITQIRMERDDYYRYKREMMEKMMEIEADTEYVPTPSYMCRWCPAFADCEHAQT